MPDIAPLPNVGSQIERALAAYFVSVGAGREYQNYFSNDSRTRKFPNNTIKAHTSGEEPKHSRTEAYQVQIQCQFPAANQPGQANPKMNRVEIDKWVGRVMAALSQREDNDEDFRATARAITLAGRALNEVDPVNDWDMADFTCQLIHFHGSSRGDSNEEGIAFLEVRNFVIHACPFNVD